MLRVFISGQKYYGAEILELCIKMEGVEVIGVCHPFGDKYISPITKRWNIPTVTSGALSADLMPKNVDLGITAHSFDYIGKRTRYTPRLGWIGYHPSLLPRHRGRASIEWAIKMKEAITGGTVFWLNAGIDRGDIAYQEFCFIQPGLLSMGSGKAAARLWRQELQPIGVRLMERALEDIKRGIIIKEPQDNRLSTWEPSMEVKDIYRPDCLLLNERGKNSADEWYK